MGFLCQTPVPTSVPAVSSTETVLPAWYQTALQGLDVQASNIANRPYTPYEGQRVAGFTAPQQQSFDVTQQAYNAYQPYLTGSTGMVLGGGAPITGADIANYMNPYQQYVTDIAKQQANLQYAQQQKAEAAKAASAGAFGGSRYGVQNAMDQYYQNQLLNQIQQQGSQQAYGQALGQAAADKARQLQAAGQLQSLAGAQQSMGLQGAAALSAIGQQQQQLQQQGLDVAYQNFLQQRDWAQNQAAWLSNILHGQNVGQTTQTQTQQFQPQTSPLTALAGLGTAGVGVAGLAKQGII